MTTPSSAQTNCPGVTEVKVISSRLVGIRVRRSLVAKIKGVAGLTQCKPGSDLFCLEVNAYETAPEDALRRFQQNVAEAGLGKHFGMQDMNIAAAQPPAAPKKSKNKSGKNKS
jgi:hypothetical protein